MILNDLSIKIILGIFNFDLIHPEHPVPHSATKDHDMTTAIEVNRALPLLLQYNIYTSRRNPDGLEAWYGLLPRELPCRRDEAISIAMVFKEVWPHMEFRVGLPQQDSGWVWGSDLEVKKCVESLLDAPRREGDSLGKRRRGRPRLTLAEKEKRKHLRAQLVLERNRLMRAALEELPLPPGEDVV